MSDKIKTVLFLGDSVTAAERKYGTDDLGEGYAAKIDAYLKTFYPQDCFKVINKGFDGHRAQNLLLRLQADCIDLKPDILTILIGVNDCWKAVSEGMVQETAITENFTACCREILTRVKNALPNCKIILMEPFIIPAEQYKEDWRIGLYSKIEALRALSREFKTVYIPLDGIFAEYCAQNDAAMYSIDSVHPIDGGHSLIAEQWIKRALHDL